MSPPNPIRASSTALVADMLARGVGVRLRLSGWSMKPLFRSGSVLTFSAASEPVLGDIALTRHANGALVAHRIVALGPDWVQTKGDACASPDARVSRTQLIGCAVLRETFAGPMRLRGRLPRAFGRLAGSAYPRLVCTFRSLRPRRGTLAC